MENNFDKYFKEKLDNRKFEMKPEYWEGAEALIEADERKGNWRRFIILFGVLLLAGVGVFIFWKKEDHQVATDKIEKTESTFGNVLLQETEEGLDKTQNTNAETLQVEKETTSSNISKEPLVENKSEKELPVWSPNRLEKEEEKIGKEENDENLENSSSVKSMEASPSTASSDLKKPIADNYFSDANVLANNAERKNTDNLNENKKDNFNENKKNSFKEDENKIEVGSIEDDFGKESNGVGETLEREDVLLIEGNKIKEKTTKEPIAATTILLPPLDVYLTNDLLAEIDVKPLWDGITNSPKRFSLGVTAGAVGYPLIENSSDKKFIGFKGGFLAEYLLKTKKNNLTIGSELLYHFRSGNFVATKQNENVKYSFGRTVSTAELTPQNLHYLELPVYLKYDFGKMNVEAGASVNYLLGAQGKVTQADGSEESGWVPTLGFKKYHANVLLGVHYKVSENLRFGMRANYTPGGILNTTGELPNGDALQESGPLYLTFRVTQYFFKK